MLRVQLRVSSGKHTGQLITLKPGNFLVGREQDCQLRPGSELVSRHHCVFKMDDYGVRLRDLGSTNGTTVNGERIQQHQLQQGDKVVIGDLHLEVVLTEAGDSAVVTPAIPPVLDSNSDVPGSETLLEIPVINPNDSSMDFDSTLQTPAAPEQAPAAEQAPAPAAPAEAQQAAPVVTPAPPQPVAPVPPMQMPAAPQYAPQQMYPPNPYMPQPGYPQQQMGYPPQYGYPQPGMPYPQQPMPQYPQQAMPQQPAPPPAEPAAVESETASDLDVTLPPPEATGAKEVEAKGSAGAGVNKEDPSTRADDIIKKMKTRGRG